MLAAFLSSALVFSISPLNYSVDKNLNPPPKPPPEKPPPLKLPPPVLPPKLLPPLKLPVDPPVN